MYRKNRAQGKHKNSVFPIVRFFRWVCFWGLTFFTLSRQESRESFVFDHPFLSGQSVSTKSKIDLAVSLLNNSPKQVEGVIARVGTSLRPEKRPVVEQQDQIILNKSHAKTIHHIPFFTPTPCLGIFTPCLGIHTPCLGILDPKIVYWKLRKNGKAENRIFIYTT